MVSPTAICYWGEQRSEDQEIIRQSCKAGPPDSDPRCPASILCLRIWETGKHLHPGIMTTPWGRYNDPDVQLRKVRGGEVICPVSGFWIKRSKCVTFLSLCLWSEGEQLGHDRLLLHPCKLRTVAPWALSAPVRVRRSGRLQSPLCDFSPTRISRVCHLVKASQQPGGMVLFPSYVKDIEAQRGEAHVLGHWAGKQQGQSLDPQISQIPDLGHLVPLLGGFILNESQKSCRSVVDESKMTHRNTLCTAELQNIELGGPSGNRKFSSPCVAFFGGGGWFLKFFDAFLWKMHIAQIHKILFASLGKKLPFPSFSWASTSNVNLVWWKEFAVSLFPTRLWVSVLAQFSRERYVCISLSFLSIHLSMHWGGSYFKEFAHVILEGGESKLCRTGWQVGGEEGMVIDCI